MRLHLTIRSVRGGSSIPLSYSYYLSTALYRWIEQSSPEYSAFLHDHGFPLDGTLRRFKHFCFSQLDVPKRRITNGRLQILSPTINWYIGMPVEETLQHLVVGMFESREFYIEREENEFVVEQVETMPEPEWKSPMRFRMISPLTVSVPEERNGRLIPHYLQADDARLSDALRRNIVNKYRSLCRSEWPARRNGSAGEHSDHTITSDYQSDLQDTEFRCTLDEKFITDRGGPEKISKLITIKQGRPDETKVRGFMCPLTIEGNPELIKFAYESGLGEKGSLGFGMLEVIE